MSSLIRSAIDAVNFNNSHGLNDAQFRAGQNALLETLLHGSKCYAGFGYLQADQVPKGEKPGIIFDETDYRNHVYPDETRRFYYIHGKLLGKNARSAAQVPAIPSTVMPTAHEKSEWSRMAQAAYSAGLNQIGHRYSIAASLGQYEQMTSSRFDALQRDYREWLVFNRFPQSAAA